MQRALLAAGFVEIGDPALYEDIHHLRPLALPELPLSIEVHMRPKWPTAHPPRVRRARRGRGPGRRSRIPGVLAPSPAHHAVLLAAHAWEHDPLSRVGSLADIAALALECGSDEAAQVAARLGRRAPVAATARTIDEVLLGGARPLRTAIWRRHLHEARERTVFEVHVERLVGPVAARARSRLRPPRRRARSWTRCAPGPRRRWGAKVRRSRARAAQRLAAPVRPPGRPVDQEKCMTELKLRGQGVAWTDVDGEIVALDEATAVYLAANEAGGLLWRALADGATRESLAASLVARVRARRASAPTPTRTRSSPRCASAGCSRARCAACRTSTTPAPGWWAWRALRSVRAQLRGGAVRDVQVPAPPRGADRRGARGARRAARARAPSCLERALVLQRWLRAQGIARDVVVGTHGGARGGFAAHAWLDGEPQPAGRRYVELTRLAP